MRDGVDKPLQRRIFFLQLLFRLLALGDVAALGDEPLNSALAVADGG